MILGKLHAFIIPSNASEGEAGDTSKSLSYSDALQSLLPALDTVYTEWEHDSQILQTEFRNLPDNPLNISCKKGCGACCFFPLIPTTAGEAFVLLNRLLGAGLTLQELQKTFMDYAQTYFRFARKQGNLPFTDSEQRSFLSLKLPCPLLKRENPDANDFSGHCTVYGARPLVCDYFHSLDSPKLCETKQPHQSIAILMERGHGAVDSVRDFERNLLGRSTLGHLPLLMAALCTKAGMDAFLRTSFETMQDEYEPGTHQALLDFSLYSEMLNSIGYDFTDQDFEKLEEAQNALSTLPE